MNQLVVAFFTCLVVYASARLQRTEELGRLLENEKTQAGNHGRQVMSVSGQAFEFAKELSEEIAGLEEKQPIDPMRQPLTDQHCDVYTDAFFIATGGTYAGCFLSCMFIDYCDLLTYTPEDGTCSLYHKPDVEWTDDGLYYCWGYDVAEAPSSEEAPASEEAIS